MPATKEQAMQKERLFYERMKAEAKAVRAKRLKRVARPGRRTFDQ